ncbi:MAG TPA: HAMP domain-containing sensor histidine kinase [Candidatus Sulfotelmatobacter sp.]|nr:HAMP domain-containing sensor histidine kinase [Candidatus Sulfotelmatobacter sp.]
MSVLSQYRWFAAAAGITLTLAAVSAVAPGGDRLAAFADLAALALMLAAIALAVANAVAHPGQERSFWTLIGLGFSLWACSQAAWSYRDLWLHRNVPNTSFFDVILFFHAVPIIAAVGWRPDLLKNEGRSHQSLRNFLMLLGWWIFLYAFIVFPHQYVVRDVDVYNACYSRLYLLENVLLLALLAQAAWTSSSGWRRLYLHLFAACLLYTAGSQLLERALTAGRYYSGSLYDVPFFGALAWMAAACLSARGWDLGSRKVTLDPRWKKVIPRFVMAALLSLPVLGLWTVLLDKSAAPSRAFRVATVLIAMLLLGALVFLRQYVQDQALMALLQESRRGYESQKRLQSELVQKEKLATLGNLVAGAAHDINHPLGNIMAYAEQLWGKERLTEEQHALLRKIMNQARRTRDLVSDLLSFAQQSPAEKIPVDVVVLLQRATQMLESRRLPGKIRVDLSIAPDFPRLHGNANQLFQAFVEIIENAMDALQEVGGGSVEISVRRQGQEAVLQFADSGPGIREPKRVFDPFYTTKPVGKGTGLGLSAVYGVILDHSGQISCENRPEGGAMFTVRLPAELKPAVKVAGAVGD